MMPDDWQPLDSPDISEASTLIFTAPQHAGQAIAWCQGLCDSVGDAAEQRFGNVLIVGITSADQLASIVGRYSDEGGRDLRYVFCLGRTRHAFEMYGKEDGMWGDVMIAGYKPTRVLGLPSAVSRTWIRPSSYTNLMPMLGAPFDQGPKACMLPAHALN